MYMQVVGQGSVSVVVVIGLNMARDKLEMFD